VTSEFATITGLPQAMSLIIASWISEGIIAKVFIKAKQWLKNAFNVVSSTSSSTGQTLF
jgi:hypothetical protein